MIAAPGLVVVVAAPSGTGKTTVCRKVVERDPRIEFSVSHTTRARRPSERDGVDYHFVDRFGFERLEREGAFLEAAEYNGNRYGTSWAAIEAPLAEGRDVLLEIEVQGARQVRARRADARFVFLLPPSLEELRRRLERRGTDPPEVVAARIELARSELAEGPNFDYAVVNDEVEACVARVLEILAVERDGDGARRSALRADCAPRPAVEALLAGGI